MAVVAQCPGCGSQQEFRTGAPVKICDHCSSVLARKDREVSSLGKVVDLAVTQSPLELNLDGRWRGAPFTLIGRAQIQHPKGGVWDEWYLAFEDGRWGWLAEAQGRFYLTFETIGAGDPPTWSEVFPGATVQLEDDGPKLFTVGERGEAELVAAAGEIPFRFTPGSKSAFADLSDGSGRFATIDYGDPDDDDDGVTIYVGRQVSLAELGIRGGESEMSARAAAAAGPLACPNCGAPVELRAPDRSMRVVCGHCSSLLDCEGPLAILDTLTQRPGQRGTIALGSKGTFDGVAYTLIGRLQRQAFYPGGEVFLWEEHLLYEPSAGFRWLVEANGHWSFVTTVPPGAVQVDYNHTPVYEGTRFRLFDMATAEVTEVWGEMYWRVETGERADSADYVAPPAMLSRETTADEINWSIGVYKTRPEIQKAFGLTESLPATSGVAANQPFKHRHATRAFAFLGLAFFLVTCGRVMTADERVVLDTQLQLEAPPVEQVPPELMGTNTIPMIVFSEPFTLVGHENVEVKLRVDVNDSWAFVAADLVNEATGEVESFEKEVSYYSGVEGGEYWSEGSPSTTHILPAVSPGSYVLRLEVQQPMMGLRDSVSVRIRQDVFRWRHAIYALIAFAVPGLLLASWKWSFEKKRWSESDHAPAGLGGGGGDD